MQVFEIRNQVRIIVRDIIKTFDILTIDDVPELNSILALAKALVMNIAEATLMTSSSNSNNARLFIFGDLEHPLELDHLFNQPFNQHPFNHPFDPGFDTVDVERGDSHADGSGVDCWMT